MKKVPPSRFFISPPLQTGLNLIPSIPLLACIYPLTSSSLQTPLLSRKLPTDLTKSLNLIRWRIGRWWNRDRDRVKERGEKLIPPKRIWPRSRGKNHFHISRQTTDSERKEGDQFQQRSRLKQTRHCAFPVWTGAQPRPVTCTTASTVSLPLAPALCETELGHLSFSFSLPPAQTLLETKCFWFLVYFSFHPAVESN